MRNQSNLLISSIVVHILALYLWLQSDTCWAEKILNLKSKKSFLKNLCFNVFHVRAHRSQPLNNIWSQTDYLDARSEWMNRSEDYSSHDIRQSISSWFLPSRERDRESTQEKIVTFSWNPSIISMFKTWHRKDQFSYSVNCC